MMARENLERNEASHHLSHSDSLDSKKHLSNPQEESYDENGEIAHIHGKKVALKKREGMSQSRDEGRLDAN
jgi:hypothetical protein